MHNQGIELRSAVGGLIGRLLSLALAAILAACSPVGPNYQPPKPVLPSTWSGQQTENAAPAKVEELAHWWTQFNDPLLASLIQRAVAANPDLKGAEARILQARAQYRLTTAAAAPSLDVSGAYSSNRRSGNVGGSSAGTTQDLFQTGFDAGWEIDLFGGVRRAVEAAEAHLAAVEEARRDVLVSLEAEVARNYLELRANQQRLATAREDCAVQEETLKLVRGLEQSGLGSKLEEAQAKTQLALISAQLPPLEDSIGQSIYRLALLLGQQPQALREELSTAAPLPAMPARLPTALPSDLLRRRPDIRQAERQLAAATADIGVATAELFPRFSLTGLVGLESSRVGDLLSSSSRYWTAGPAVRWALFDGGRVRANIAFMQGRRQEAEAAYEKAVLTALNEVEAALLSLDREKETRRTLVEAVTAGQRAVDLATGRYRSGLAGFLDVLQSESALFQSRDQLAQSEQRLAVDQVALFKALGGGWQVPDERSASTGEALNSLADPSPTPSGDMHQ